MTIFPQSLRIGIDIIHILQYVHPQTPVLSSAERRHILLSYSLGIKQNSWSTNVASSNHRFIRLSWCLLHSVIRLQLLVGILIPSAGKFILIVLHKLQLLLQLSRIPPVITVTKTDISPLSCTDAYVARQTCTTIFFGSDYLYSVIHSLHLVQHFGCFWRRATVINDYQLPIRVSLGYDCFNRDTDVCCRIIIRHDNTYLHKRFGIIDIKQDEYIIQPAVFGKIL